MAEETTKSGIALVTGANKGIGREVAAQLAEQGFTVLVGARDAALGAAAADEISAAGGDAQFVRLDVTDDDSVRIAADFIGERFGRLDVLVNNAGISGGIDTLIPSTANPDSVRAVFDTNVFGVIRVTNAVLPWLLRSTAPRIVNLSSSVGSLSIMGDPAGPFANVPASAGYAPSKTALNAITVQYAKELRKDNVLVNAADPGRCDTDLIRGVGFPSPRTAAEGATVAVRLATLGPDGPTGGIFSETGSVPW
ncbi:NADP-dependent 3-hydroxy acid dehydrogenase YdfG [Parafrankia irregularis]|uniref:NADP-dependent 3-hydroxy acid dehydrogenase YdfG n=1 Tax=Parafrankia irregularis TaxID=795642 RepID=A0A0S4QR46_9ACTN|nr:MULTISPECIES: SDR family NAD(P)-dependent oxidoreductase [Parafrankia]MBE3199930.1 SDR family NAD(P)-dependent oxidoreductase [Parafrankia sp. CH37]CUU58087.1 NADP-dependent 3-hydroxy acid dehydrogenase YdfG [Parafrankia irregularis]